MLGLNLQCREAADPHSWESWTRMMLDFMTWPWPWHSRHTYASKDFGTLCKDRRSQICSADSASYYMLSCVYAKLTVIRIFFLVNFANITWQKSCWMRVPWLHFTFGVSLHLCLVAPFQGSGSGRLVLIRMTACHLKILSRSPLHLVYPTGAICLHESADCGTKHTVINWNTVCH